MSEVLTDRLYVVEQNVKVSSVCVNHRPYFSHLAKKHFKNHFL